MPTSPRGRPPDRYRGGGRSPERRPRDTVVIKVRERPAPAPVRRIRRKRRSIPRKYIAVLCAVAFLLPLWILSRPGEPTEYYVKPEAAAAGAGIPADTGTTPPAGSKPQSDQVSSTKGSSAGDRHTSGTVMFQGNSTHYTLVQPVVDNRAAFARCFPNGVYSGDLGDRSHMEDHPPQDHTPGSASIYHGAHAKRGWIYAQDLGASTDTKQTFYIAGFARWLLDQVRDGKYPEVKYIITRMSENQGRDGGRYFGIASRSGGWKMYPSSGHTEHIHISYMMSYNGVDMEHAHSTIVLDYAHSIGRSC